MNTIEFSYVFPTQQILAGLMLFLWFVAPGCQKKTEVEIAWENMQVIFRKGNQKEVLKNISKDSLKKFVAWQKKNNLKQHAGAKKHSNTTKKNMFSFLYHLRDHTKKKHVIKINKATLFFLNEFQRTVEIHLVKESGVWKFQWL